MFYGAGNTDLFEDVAIVTREKGDARYVRQSVFEALVTAMVAKGALSASEAAAIRSAV